MRVGLSWDLDTDGRAAPEAWRAVLGELTTADGLGYDSAWVEESRTGASSCPAPALFLTFVARRTSSIGLRVAGRHVGRASVVRTAEEIAVLDLFSRGRAGIGFASASRQGAQPAHVHEAIDFVSAAWATDAFRYRGTSVRFPSHTRDEVPEGLSTEPGAEPYVPQWERGPAMPDFLAVTPKPYASRPALCVEIDDDSTLEWAAQRDVSPFVSAAVPTDEAVVRLARYRDAAAVAGRPPWTAEPVLERRIDLDEPGDDRALGGSASEVVAALRALRGAAGVSHLVWRRRSEQLGRSDELFRFAAEVQPLLQA